MLKNKLSLFCVSMLLIFCGSLFLIQTSFAEEQTAMDSDRDGFLGTLDLCPQIYGKIQGCSTFQSSLVGTQNTLLSKSDVVLPVCDTPEGCTCTLVQDQEMLRAGDALLIQVKGSPHVSVPFEIE